MHRERVGAGLGGDGLGEAGEHGRIRVVAADEVDEPEHLLQHGGIDRARGLHAVRDVPAQPVRVQVGERDPDDRHRELAARDQPVERGSTSLRARSPVMPNSTRTSAARGPPSSVVIRSAPDPPGSGTAAGR